MNDLASDILIQRLDVLEREVRWYKLFGIVTLALVGLVVIFVAVRTKVPQELRAGRFAVVDAAGKERAVLHMIATGMDGTPGLSLFDREQNRRVQLSLHDDGPALEFYRKGNKRLLSMWTLADSLPTLTLYDTNEKPRIQLDLLPDSSPRIYLADAQHIRLRLGAATEGRSQVEIIDSKGETFWKAP